MAIPIEQYGLIGDMRSCALISPEGSVDWLCWPRFDSPALLLRLLDETRGGVCDLEAAALLFVRQRYLPATNVLETLLETRDGILSVQDFMPVRATPTGRFGEGADTHAEGRLIRRLQCLKGHVTATLRIRPAFDYARRRSGPISLLARGHGVRFGEAPHSLRLEASHPLALEEGSEGPGVRLQVALRKGERAWVGLTPDLDAAPLDDRRVETLLAETRGYWEQWSGRVTYEGRWRGALLRSLLCLKLLTYAPTGAIIAAATTSLPESLEGERNFDYRFTWMRDASFSISAFLHLGHEHEAAEFLRFLHKADGVHGKHFKLLYGIAGEVPDEQVLPHLSGWRGRGPVRIGNVAFRQRQYDIYGEFLSSLHLYLEHVGGQRPADFEGSAGELLVSLAQQALRHRDTPDNGVWEMRGPLQHFQHTKALLWVALDRAARSAELLGRPSGTDPEGWSRAARELRAEYLERTWNAERGYYAQAYGSSVLDAAVMRTVLYGAISPEDPRLEATLTAIERELAEGELIYRYREGADGFRGEEGAFFACGFWLAGCRAMQGHTRRAMELFDRLLERGGPLGLFAEEIDTRSGGHLGNYPQAFTHMALINNGVRIERCIERFGVR